MISPFWSDVVNFLCCSFQDITCEKNNFDVSQNIEYIFPDGIQSWARGKYSQPLIVVSNVFKSKLRYEALQGTNLDSAIVSF